MFSNDKFSKKIFLMIVFSILISIFLLTGAFTFLRNIKATSPSILTTSGPYISFNTTYAQPGSPITVTLNESKQIDISYQWTIGNSISENISDTYTPSSDDLEKFITVSVTFDNETISSSLYCSKLPVIYINTQDKKEVNDEYTKSVFSMQNTPQYSNPEYSYYGEAYIKLRGNSTKKRDKLPYKIKLDKDANLFNLGENKHWVLLANDIDHTFIRNKLIYDFSNAISNDFACESLNVILILNNEYRGVYQLCEQIRIDSERVDIFDYKELADEAADLIIDIKKQNEGMDDSTADIIRLDMKNQLESDFSWLSEPYEFIYNGTTYTMTDYINIPELTGGFLLEMDFYNINLPDDQSLMTNFQQPLYFNSPEYIYTNNELFNYSKNYMQTFEYALHSDDFIFRNSDEHYRGTGIYYDSDKGWINTTDEIFYIDKNNNNKHYSQLFDMDSLINNFLVCEFSMNWDSMKNSVFISKDINELAKLNPVWDFDWCFGNLNMYNINTYFPQSWHTTNNYFTNEYYYQSVQWNRYLIKDPFFLFGVYNKYKEIRPTVINDIIKDGGKIDQYEQLLKEAGDRNDDLWSYSYQAYGGELFSESYDSLKNFINTRIKWLDDQFSSFDTFVDSLGYYQTSNTIYFDQIIYNKDSVDITVSTSNTQCNQISFQINGIDIVTSKLSNGKATVTLDYLNLNNINENIVVVRLLNSFGDYIKTSNDSTLFGDNPDEAFVVSNYRIF